MRGEGTPTPEDQSALRVETRRAPCSRRAPGGVSASFLLRKGPDHGRDSRPCRIPAHTEVTPDPDSARHHEPEQSTVHGLARVLHEGQRHMANRSSFSATETTWPSSRNRIRGSRASIPLQVILPSWRPASPLPRSMSGSPRRGCRSGTPRGTARIRSGSARDCRDRRTSAPSSSEPSRPFADFA